MVSLAKEGFGDATAPKSAAAPVRNASRREIAFNAVLPLFVDVLGRLNASEQMNSKGNVKRRYMMMAMITILIFKLI
jgi:hypothetical protein